MFQENVQDCSCPCWIRTLHSGRWAPVRAPTNGGTTDCNTLEPAPKQLLFLIARLEQSGSRGVKRRVRSKVGSTRFDEEKCRQSIVARVTDPDRSLPPPWEEDRGRPRSTGGLYAGDARMLFIPCPIKSFRKMKKFAGQQEGGGMSRFPRSTRERDSRERREHYLV